MVSGLRCSLGTLKDLVCEKPVQVLSKPNMIAGCTQLSPDKMIVNLKAEHLNKNPLPFIPGGHATPIRQMGMYYSPYCPYFSNTPAIANGLQQMPL